MPSQKGGARGGRKGRGASSTTAQDANTGFVEILTCAVRRGQQRRGIGRLLVRWAQQLAADDRYGTMLVAASLDRERFWSSLGFVEPPGHVAPEAISGLQVQFEHSTVLYCDPRAEANEVRPAAELMISAVNAKRQRRAL